MISYNIDQQKENIGTKLSIAIVANRFPKISETFVSNHVIDLMNLGHDVDIYAFKTPTDDALHHENIIDYKLLEKANYLEIPRNKRERKDKTAKILLRNMFKHDHWIRACLNMNRFTKTRATNNLFRTESLLKKKYDVIHCHFGTTANKILILKDLFPKTKLFVTFHGYDIRLGLKRGTKMYRELFQKADGIISICRYNREKLIALGCPVSKIIDLPNGVSLDTFKRNRANQNGQAIITSVARLANSKNIFFALEIMRRIKEEGKYNFKYIVLGDGKFREKIERMIDEYKLQDHVALMGTATREMVINQLRKTDIFLLPSKKEAFPVCLLEAQAMGIPVVATNIGGVCEAVRDQVTGFIVDSGEVHQAKKRIYKLLDDQQLKTSMGKAAREFIKEKFDINQLNQKLVGHYIKVYKKPKVTVIIPAFNRVHVLPSTIDSVLNQTFQDFELIIVDDGSVDNTNEVVNEYIDNNEDKIKYIYQTHRGASVARNQGIINARGKYIALLDSDDVWLPSKLSKQIKVLDQENIGLVHTSRTIIDLSNRKRSSLLPVPQNYAQKSEDMLEGTSYLAMTPLIRKEVFQKVGMFNEDLFTTMDMDMWFRIAQKSRIGFIDEPLMISYKLQDGLSIKNLEQKYKDRIEVYKRILDDNHPKIAKSRWEKRMAETIEVLNLEIFERKKLCEDLTRQLDDKIVVDYTSGSIRYRDSEPVVKLDCDLWVVRHGQTHINLKLDENGQWSFSGNSNDKENNLNNTGIKQAKEAAAQLYNNLQSIINDREGIVVITSGLSRAKDTAQIFINYTTKKNAKININVIEDERLNEMNCGLWNNKTPLELTEYETDIWRWRKKSDVTVIPPQGENFLNVIVRTKEALDEYNKKFKGKCVVLFGHAMALNAVRIVLRHESIMLDDGKMDWRNNGFVHAHPVRLDDSRLGKSRQPSPDIPNINKL